MLFDHCCDSMTSYLITTTIGTIIGCTRLIEYVILWLMVAFPFFAVIWEENFTHYFYLPIINGVSEGTVVTCLALHLFGFYGTKFLNQTLIIFGTAHTLRTIVIVSFFMFGVIFSLMR